MLADVAVSARITPILSPAHSLSHKVAMPMAQDAEVIFEAVRTGDWLRVAAICPRTGVESVAAGPADSLTLLQRIAAAKLARKLSAHAAERAS
jgi:hypothetical protein